MPMTNTPIFAQTIINPTAQILPTNGTGYVTLRVGSANGDRLDSLFCTTNDTIAHTLMFALNDGVVDHPVGEVNIPAQAGTDGAAAVKGVNVLTPANFPGLANSNGSFFLQSTYTLKVRAEVAVQAGKQIDLVGFGGAY